MLLPYVYGIYFAEFTRVDNKLAWQCQWCDVVRPLRLMDVIQGMSYEWIYNEPDDFLPIRIFVQGKALENLGVTSGVWGADNESFLVAYDQVGALRALINSAGEIVKRIDYDSFGNVLYDTLPEFFIPQGFASGMTDRFALYLRKARFSPTQTCEKARTAYIKSLLEFAGAFLLLVLLAPIIMPYLRGWR